MTTYNPKKTPDSAAWLALDELERIDLAAAHHRRIRARLPNLQLHATIHVVVENQLAEGTKTVQDTLERLMDEGLNRHDAIHAIGSVLAGHIWSLLRDGAAEPNTNEQYYHALRSLTAKKWMESGN
jgi:hypothetical protein